MKVTPVLHDEIYEDKGRVFSRKKIYSKSDENLQERNMFHEKTIFDYNITMTLTLHCIKTDSFKHLQKDEYWYAANNAKITNSSPY